MKALITTLITSTLITSSLLAAGFFSQALATVTAPPELRPGERVRVQVELGDAAGLDKATGLLGFRSFDLIRQGQSNVLVGEVTVPQFQLNLGLSTVSEQLEILISDQVGNITQLTGNNDVLLNRSLRVRGMRRALDPEFRNLSVTKLSATRIAIRFDVRSRASSASASAKAEVINQQENLRTFQVAETSLSCTRSGRAFHHCRGEMNLPATVPGELVLRLATVGEDGSQLSSSYYASSAPLFVWLQRQVTEADRRNFAQPEESLSRSTISQVRVISQQGREVEIGFNYQGSTPVGPGVKITFFREGDTIWPEAITEGASLSCQDSACRMKVTLPEAVPSLNIEYIGLKLDNDVPLEQLEIDARSIDWSAVELDREPLIINSVTVEKIN